MKRFNKILAVFLAVVMIVGLMVTGVSATEPTYKVIYHEGFEIGETFKSKDGAVENSTKDGSTRVHNWNHAEPTGTNGTIGLYYSSGDSCLVEVVDGVGRNGGDCFKLSTTTNTKQAMIITLENVGNLHTHGKQYVVSAWFKFEGFTSTQNTSAGMRVKSCAFAQNPSVSYTAKSDEGWIKLELPYTYDSTKDEFMFDFTVPAVGTAVAYVDDIEITERDASTIVTGAVSGDTVALTEDRTETAEVVIPAGVTLDLAGKTLTVPSLAALKGANVIDSVGGGKLVVADGNPMLQKDNSYVPVKDGVGYVFLNATTKVDQEAAEGNLTYQVKPSLTAGAGTDNLANTLFADGAADNGITVVIRISWKVGENDVSLDFVANDELVESVYTPNEGGQYAPFSLTASNVAEGATVSTVLISDAGVEFVVPAAN